MGEASRYLVIGGDGFIGSSLCKHLSEAGKSFVETTRRPERLSKKRSFLDLSEDPSNWQCPKDISVAFICAGVSSVKTCRENPGLTRTVNVVNTHKLARSLVENDINVVFLSTNMVFDGSTPYPKIDQPVNPKTEYGRQKAEAEAKLLALGELVAVVRFTKIIDAKMPLLKGWIQTLRKNKPIHPFCDKVMSPVPLSFAVRILCSVAEKRISGIIQISSDRQITYAAAAQCIAEKIGADKLCVKPIRAFESESFCGSVAKYTTLNVDRLRSVLGIEAPNIQWTIESALENISEI